MLQSAEVSSDFKRTLAMVVPSTSSRSWSKASQFISDEKNAVLLKALIYCFHGGAVCIFPIIVLQMQLLGISIQEVAIVALIGPIASLLGPVASGLIADKLGRYGNILIVNILLMTVCYDLLLTVPKVPDFTATITCSNEQYVQLQIDSCNKCFRGVTEDTIQLQNTANNSLCDLFQTDFACYQNTTTISTNIVALDGQECGFKMVNDNSSVYECNSDESLVMKMTNSAQCPHDITNEFSSAFYIFLLIRAFGAFFTTAAFTMLDASIIAEANKHSLSLGKQRIFVMLGYATTPPLAGWLTDTYSSSIGYTSYLPNFILGTILLLIAAVLMSFLNVKVESSKENMIRNFGYLLTRIEIIVFLMMLLLLGCNFGFIENYLFLFMNSLGAPAIAFGLTITSGCLASIPLLYVSDYIHEKIAFEYIYLICFTGYAVRLAGYSIITNPWMALAFETIEAINYQLMWVTSLKFFPVLAPDMIATMTGLAMATHYAFGGGVGAFVGGYVIEAYGYRVAFRSFAVGSLVAGAVSFLAHRLVINKRIARN